MHLFGLTGGIASGKSAVAARFRALGVPVVDADLVAREIVAFGKPALAELVVAFGEGILLPTGELDRKRLGQIAFADPEARRRLDAITHPRISEASMGQVAAHAARGEPLVCYEAALLVENGLLEGFRPLVVVAADERTQIARAGRRDGSTEDEARARVLAQMPLAKKRAVADVIIENDGTLEELTARADAALRTVCEVTGTDPARFLI